MNDMKERKKIHDNKRKKQDNGKKKKQINIQEHKNKWKKRRRRSKG